MAKLDKYSSNSVLEGYVEEQLVTTKGRFLLYSGLEG